MGTSERGLNSSYWFCGVMLTAASAVLSLLRRSTRYPRSVSTERWKSSVVQLNSTMKFEIGMIRHTADWALAHTVNRRRVVILLLLLVPMNA